MVLERLDHFVRRVNRRAGLPVTNQWMQLRALAGNAEARRAYKADGPKRRAFARGLLFGRGTATALPRILASLGEEAAASARRLLR